MAEKQYVQDLCDHCHSGLPCKPHGNKSLLICENVLLSGISCPYSVCDECWNYNEGNEHILPTRTSIFCYDCINITKQKSVDNDMSTMMSSTMTQPTLCRNIINAPIVSTQKDTIDLSQLSPSPTRNANIQPRITPKRLFNSINSSTDDAKRVSFQCDNTSSDESLTPKRLFRSIDDGSNESIDSDNISSDESTNVNHLSSSDNSNDIVARKLPSWKSLHGSDGQTPCSGYQSKPSSAGGIDQGIEQLVDDNNNTGIIAVADNITTGRTQVRNPYNNVACSVALNGTPYQLEESHPIHVPDWYLNQIVSNNPPEVTGAIIRNMCWVTDQLKLEIELNLPNATEINIDAVTGICTRDLEAFKFKCSSLFPKGRIFMSETQLDQCAKYFLDGWNVKKVHNSKKIKCFYGTGRKNTYVSKCAPEKDVILSLH